MSEVVGCNFLTHRQPYKVSSLSLWFCIDGIHWSNFKVQQKELQPQTSLWQINAHIYTIRIIYSMKVKMKNIYLDFTETFG